MSDEATNVDLIRRDTGEVVMTLPMPAHVSRLAAAVAGYAALYGVILDLDTLRFGTP